MWGLALSFLTIAISMVTKKDNDTDGNNARSSSPLSLGFFGVGGNLTRENRIFLSGAVLGVGCSLLYRALADYFQLHLRFRLFWISLWPENPEKEQDAPWYESASIQEARDFLVRTEDGSIRMIVTPRKDVTSTLNVTLLTLHPGREIPSTMSVGVEFYYVIAGSGRFSQQGVINSRGDLTVGDCFVVQPRRMRWLSNSKGTEDFVLLRASDDGAQQYSGGSQSSLADRIRMDPTQYHNPVFRLRDGIRKVHSMANDYVRKNFSGEWKSAD